MAKTVFSNGSRAYAPWFNAIQSLVFDGQDLDGHYPSITNADLSNVAGQIKPEWETFRDTLKVAAGTGLSVTVQGGAVMLPNSMIATVAPTTLAVSNNAVQYVYVSSAGVAAVATSLPILALPLAKVTTVAGAVTIVEDLRPRFRIFPRANAVKVFGGFGDEGDYTLSGTATFSQGEYFFRNFTIQAGATLTIDKLARIYVSGTATIAGTIIVNQAFKGGAATSYGGITGQVAGSAGAGIGGGTLVGGDSYNYQVSSAGSGGGAGQANSTGANYNLAGGGAGGGALIIEAAESISVTGVITAVGSNATAGTVGSGTPSLSGAGGGSGGLILLKALSSITIGATATLNVSGGNGSNAISGGGSGGSIIGGGGGGGGIVGLIAPSVNTTGATITLSGGTGGTTAAASASVAGGGGGGFGGAGGSATSTPAIAGSTGLLTVRTFAPIS